MFQIHFVSCNITLETDLFIKNVLTFFFIDYDKIFENDESQHVIKNVAEVFKGLENLHFK